MDQQRTERGFQEFTPRPEWLGAIWQDSFPHASLFLTPDEQDGPCIAIGGRYWIVFQSSWVPDDGDRTLYQGDDENAARQWTRAAEIAKTIIADVLATPDCMAARSFAQLHDHCDANMLGEQAEFLAECGWTGTDDRKDEAALTASTDVLNFAQDIVGHWLARR